MSLTALHTLRASILRRIQGRSGIIALRQQVYAFTHQIMAGDKR